MRNHLYVQSSLRYFRFKTIILWLGIVMLLFLTPYAFATTLEPIEQVNGTIWDVGSYRILYLDNSENEPRLKIRYRASGKNSAIPIIDKKVPSYGYLSRGGAVFVASGESVLESRIYEWKNGVLHSLGYPNSSNSLKVSRSQDYAIWNGGLNNLFEGSLILRDLEKGTNTIVSSDNVGNWFNDVTNRGKVVYWTNGHSYNILRYQDGVTTRLTNDQYFWNTYLLTDGVNIVYRKHDPCCHNQYYQITLYNDKLGEIPLSPMRSIEPKSGLDYQVHGGWVAFTQPGKNSNELQVWTRSSSGITKQISSFNVPSFIDVLAPSGDVTFIANNHRYLAVRGKRPIDIGLADGKSLWLKGKWYVYSGGTLFQVMP